MVRKILVGAMVLIVGAARCPGQSFNVDVGPAGAGPADSYAAAGLPGHWISIPATQGVSYLNLVDIHGNLTQARLNQFGGTETVVIADGDLTGQDAVPMNDCLITHTLIENCIFFSDLEPGTYDVLIYARMPAQPGIEAVTNVDQEPGNPHHLVGGPWPGQHAPGVSYAHHVAVVAPSGPDAGRLWLHSGVAGGGDLGIGAALNGFQVRKRPACAADIDGNGTVAVADLVAVLLGWGACSGFCAGDVNRDGAVDVVDLVEVITAWGACG
jgi:hypothetical protein